MRRSAETRSGPCEIHAPSGAGGMGMAYSARGLRLNHDGGIKDSRRKFSGRFDLVAQPITALNYASTCQADDVDPNCGATIGEMTADAHFALVRLALGTSHADLAMESVEETPLNRRLPGQASSL